MRSRDPAVLLEAARRGDRGATGRLLSLVETGGAGGAATAALTVAASASVRRVVGLTGAPGAGKSTLADRLIGCARAEGTVGVVAVDPSSPFTGGAILGDRVRMQDHSDDPGVFIRSMATRGHLGGLSLAVPQAVRVLAAVGMDTVLIETVGVGQVEIEVAGAADTTVVVVNPGWGDDVQATKAGLLEIADVLVVNKADRPGAAAARRDLEAMLDAAAASVPALADWRPPVVLTSAADGTGVDELWAAVVEHGTRLAEHGQLARRRSDRLLEELRRTVVQRLAADLPRLAGDERYERVAAEVVAHRLDPQLAAEELVAGIGGR